MTEIVIQGIGGRMGHVLCDMIAQREDCRVVAGIDMQDGEQNGIPVYDSLEKLNGKGVISVVSNVAPELVHNCCQAFFDGDTAKACALQLEMLPLEEALFCEVNPIPVKYAMNVLGWNAGECRLPLVEPSDAHKAKIEQALQAAGLIKE